MKKYCIIPARSGSKGLPNKNVLFIDGKPLIRHTIDAAIKSSNFDGIYLSTDSQKYYSLIEDSGVGLHLRGEELSNDKAPSSAFMVDFLTKCVVEEDAIVVLCQPTSPLRNGKHISEAIELFENSVCTSLIGVEKVEKSLKLFSSIKNGYISDLEGVDKDYRRQDSVKDLYVPNGSLFITTKKFYLKNITFFDKKTIPYIMDQKSSIDVDGLVDFNSALGNMLQNFTEKREEIIEQQQKKLAEIDFSTDIVVLGDSRISNFKNENVYAYSGFLVHSFNDVIAKLKNKKVVISLGINDFQAGYTAVEIAKKYEEYITILRYNNNEVHVIEVIETLNRPLFNNSEIKKLNTELSKMEKINFKKVNQYFCDENGLKFENTLDGIHLLSNIEGLLFNEIEKIWIKSGEK